MAPTTKPRRRVTSSQVIDPTSGTDTDEVATFAEAYKIIWTYKWKHSRSAKTCAINAGHFLECVGGSTPLKRCAKAFWWTQKMEELRDDHPQWSDSTLNRVISAGTTIVRYAHKQGLTDVIVPSFDRKPESESRIFWFTKEEVETLAFTAVDIYDRKDLADAIVFSAYTGVRQGELLKLRVEDIDWSLRNVWVGGRPGRVTKGNECRCIPMPDRIEQIVRERCKDANPRATVFGRDWANKDQLYYAFKKVRKYAGFNEDYVWHCLRHSFGTWLGEVTHPRQIMSLMGHKQIDTTLHYCKATDSANRQAMDSL